MTLKELINEKEQILRGMQVIEERLAFLDQEIAGAVAADIAKVRLLQGKEFGAASAVVDGYKVTQTIPKRVEWDQEKMGQIFEQIMKTGDKPGNYMKAKLEVPEKMYESFGPEVKSIFADARTVKAGKPTIKVEEVQGA